MSTKTMKTYPNTKRLDNLKLSEDEIKKISQEFKAVYVYIHTGDQNIRQRIFGLPETIKEIVDSCTLIKKYGLKLIVTHTFGIPMETETSNDVSLNLYTIIKPDLIECENLVYKAGSPLITHAVALGCLSIAQAREINTGKDFEVKNNLFYKQYAKTFCALPIGGLLSEVMPMCLIKFVARRKLVQSIR